MRSLARVALALTTTVLVATACTSHKATSPPTSSSHKGTAAPATTGPLITISSFQFRGELTVKPGVTVTVRNKDSAPHTLTDKAGAFTTATLDQGQSGTFTAPTKPGKYQLICKIHASMSGTLVVSG